MKCKVCNIESIYAKGLCHKCYSRQYYGVKRPRVEYFICEICGTDKNKKTQELCKKCYYKKYYLKKHKKV